jgi:hypothetical protein
MIKKRNLTFRGEFMTSSLTWEQQEVFRLLKAQPGTTYQEADEEGRKFFRDWVRGLLTSAEVTVTFVKADGTVRDMRCTLDQDRMPPQPPAKGSSDPWSILGEAKKAKEVKAPEESHTQKVFDLDAGAWRSFRYDRLKKIGATLNFE